MEWTYTETTAIPRWKIGLWIWRDEGEWRLRLYRPWRRHRMVEIQCKDFPWALYLLGGAAGWWKITNKENNA